MELSIIQSKIHEIRSLRVMLDFDLSELYGIETKRLKEAVRRNIERFPPDFMFELTREEYLFLRSQFATLEIGRGKYAKYQPYAFTEQGVAMLSSVLNSKRAIEININIMRAFVSIRSYLLNQISTSEEIKELWQRVKDLEEQSEENLKAISDLSEDNQNSFDEIYIALSELANKQTEKSKPRRPVGFIKPNNIENQ